MVFIVILFIHCFLAQNMFAVFVIYYLFKVTYKSMEGWVLLSIFLCNPCQHNTCHYSKLIQ